MTGAVYAANAESPCRRRRRRAHAPVAEVILEDAAWSLHSTRRHPCRPHAKPLPPDSCHHQYSAIAPRSNTERRTVSTGRWCKRLGRIFDSCNQQVGGLPCATLEPALALHLARTVG